MCGIAGFLGLGDEAALRRMAQRLVHRGPDEEGFLVDLAHRAYLAHRRLSILDLSGGQQPMQSRDGKLTIVFNGEIYNFRELRAQLQQLGAQFTSDHSDTEVLLLAWQHWGPSMFERLNGMWAFAILDLNRQQLILSRDRFGKKPLFFCRRPDGFAFSSELISLRQHPATPSAPCERALRKYYAYGFVPAPLTFIEGVSKLPGGHWMTVQLDSYEVGVHRFWQYQAEPPDTYSRKDVSGWTDQLLELLERAVQRRLVADVPVGSFLSGGIDSSTVSALAMKTAGSRRLQTFSIGFDEATFDETVYAQAVARHIGADHHVEQLSIDRAIEILPDILSGLDEPIGDSSILPTYLLCKYARQHVTVAIGGDGADELLAGYDPFVALRYASLYDRMVPRPIHRAISLVASKLPVSHRYMSFDFRLKRTLRGLDHSPNLWLPVWMAPLAPSELEALFRAPVDLDDLFSEAIEAWDGCVSKDPVDRTIAFYIKLYLQEDILVKVDRASMLNSLEVRSPFLDIDFVDFVRRLPAAVKIRRGETKWILKRAAATLLPEQVLKRSKQGFGVPIGKWFSEDRLPADPPGAYNPKFWSAAVHEHRTLQADQRAYLWSDWLLSRSHLYSRS